MTDYDLVIVGAGSGKMLPTAVLKGMRVAIIKHRSVRRYLPQPKRLGSQQNHRRRAEDEDVVKLNPIDPTDANTWYWCLDHNAAEPDDSNCPPNSRIGPYASKPDAEHWRARVDQRNASWDAADRRWENDEPFDSPAVGDQPS